MAIFIELSLFKMQGGHTVLPLPGATTTKPGSAVSKTEIGISFIGYAVSKNLGIASAMDTYLYNILVS